MAVENNEKTEKKFALKHTYVKSQQFRYKVPPLNLRARDEKMQYQQELQAQITKGGETLYEVTLVLGVTGKLGEQSLFNIELEYAGLFELEGLTEQEIAQVLNVQAPHMLYPYAARVATQMTVDAGLAPMYLVPIDFAGLYLQKAEGKSWGNGAEVKQTDESEGEVYRPTETSVLHS